MDCIITDKEFREIGIAPDYLSFDLDLANNKDFEIKGTRDENILDYGFAFFVPETEIGGILGELYTNSTTNDLNWIGDTWRGLLNKQIIEPNTGDDYKIVSGNVKDILENLLGTRYGALFRVDPNLNMEITSYQFHRYTTLLDGVTDLLKKENCKLVIEAVQGGSGQSFYVKLSVEEIVDYSNEVEFETGHIGVSVQDSRRGINHLICLGEGELKDRQVIHLYAQLDGTVGKTKYYTGLAERTATYDYPFDDEDGILETMGREKLKELMNFKNVQVDLDESTLKIGDIVSARDRITGSYASNQIVNKIITINNGAITTECKMEGEY